MGCCRLVPKGFCDSAWAVTRPFCANLEAGPSAAPASGRVLSPLCLWPLLILHPAPGLPGEKYKPPLSWSLTLSELLAARSRSSSQEPFMQHACKLAAETCWDQVGPVAIPGLRGDFQRVSTWLTIHWACSPQSPFLPSVGSCLHDLDEGCKRVCSPLCRGQQMMFVVASNVLLWQRWPAAPTAVLGRASPAVEGDNLSLLLSTGEMT